MTTPAHMSVAARLVLGLGANLAHRGETLVASKLLMENVRIGACKRSNASARYHASFGPWFLE